MFVFDGINVPIEAKEALLTWRMESHFQKGNRGDHTNMNSSTLWEGFEDKSALQGQHLNSVAADAIRYVIQNYLYALTSSFVLTLSCRHTHTNHFYGDLLEQVLGKHDMPVMQLVAMRPDAPRHVPGRRLFNIILADSLDAFLDIDVISYTANYNNNEFYYIFLQARDHLIHREMQGIFEYCWSHQIINCNIQVQNSNGEVLIYTYFPFTKENCHSVTPVLINRFNGTALMMGTLFPKKLHNFFGCTLKCATWHVPPFVYLEADENGVDHVVGGIEGRLLFELSRRLNFKIVVTIPPNDERRGKLVNRATWQYNGALGMMQNRTVDFSMGFIRSTADRSNISTSTKSYYITAQAASVVRSVYGLTSLDILHHSFKGETWGLLLAILAVISLGLASVRKLFRQYRRLFYNDQPSNSYLDLVLIIVGTPEISKPHHSSSRIFFITCMLSTLILRTAYQGLLFHLIRTHLANRMPQTFEELIADNYTVIINRSTYEALMDIAFLKDLAKIILNDTVDTMVFEYMENVHQLGLAAVGPVDFLLYYSAQQKKAGIFKLLPQNIVGFAITIYMPKHSFLVDQFDEEIMWMHEVGLVTGWWRYYLDEKYFSSEHLFKDSVFGWKELHMAFAFGFGGLCCSAVIFVMEVLSSRISWLRYIFAPNNVLLC